MTPWMDKVYREVDAEASRSDRAEAPARGALLTGVFLSGAILMLGLLITFLQHEPRPNDPPNLREMIRGIAAFRGVTLIYLGLIVLAATPILRVTVMIGVYLRRREWFMLIVSLIVLGLLTVGVVVGTG